MTRLEQYFEPYRQNIIGYHQTFRTPFGEHRICYADWIASGRLYRPIEEKLMTGFGPFVANTHSYDNATGGTMTEAYHWAHGIIKQHVNARPDDMLITAGSGMTGVVNKFQRMLGLRVPCKLKPHLHVPENERPIVLITHMEHHSNETSWMETIADVVRLAPDETGQVCCVELEKTLAQYPDRALKIGAFSACSNVTGIQTDYHRMARIMHEHGGVCFLDFAASAPYVDINMHPADPMEKLDAIYFSPHKFLGGPGACGILLFDRALYQNTVPDHPGGGTVRWTTPWDTQTHAFFDDIETREDGGTPAFLQTIKAALAIQLKEQMTPEAMLEREEELLEIAFNELPKVPGMHILEAHLTNRIGAISFNVEGLHYNLLVRILNDRYGIQVRGGWSCAGPYGHYLFHIDRAHSQQITDHIDAKDFSLRPGWVRLSLHPTMTNQELDFILKALHEIEANKTEWAQDYVYMPAKNSFTFRQQNGHTTSPTSWFALDPVTVTAPETHID